MAELIIPHDLANGTIVDAEALDDNFRAIAAVVNGGLGLDNLGGGVPASDKSTTFRKLAPGLMSVYSIADGEWEISSANNTYKKSAVVVVPQFTPDIDCQIIVQAVIGSYMNEPANDVKYYIGVCEDIQNQLPTSPPLHQFPVYNFSHDSGEAWQQGTVMFAMNLTAGKPYRFVVTGKWTDNRPSVSTDRHVTISQSKSLYWLLPR